MLKSPVFTVMSVILLLLAACAPVAATPSPIVTEEPGIPVTSVAVVESVEIQILKSMPVQVQAVIRGQLPDAGCTTIRAVDQVRNGNVITLTLVTTTDPLALCAQALTPFEHVARIDVSNLPAGTYTVDVHGVEATFELPGESASQFPQLLVDALNARDYELLKSMMGESFMIGYWQSEGTSNTPEEAIEQLQLNLLSTSSPIVADPEKDLVTLLGMDPVRIVGPSAVEASPLFTSGWGQEGKDEAILFIARRSDGSPYWYGMLFARDGFAASGMLPIEPIDGEAYPTGVQYVLAQRDVQIYNGPGTDHEVIGQIFAGQVARVTGTNVFGSWWRIVCPDESTESCWVSGDPNDMQPTQGPG